MLLVQHHPASGLTVHVHAKGKDFSPSPDEKGSGRGAPVNRHREPAMAVES
jgi:hypothetical protein